MLYLVYPLNALLMVLLPVALAVMLHRRYGAGWKAIGIGAATFVASQVVHIPLNVGLTLAFKQGWLPGPPAHLALPFNAVVLGFTAGLCEEVARYLAYRHAFREGRTWRDGMMLGAGHGGIEAILLGTLTGMAFVSLLALQLMDPARLGVPAAQLPLVKQQVAQYWSAPWPVALLGAVERVFALAIHLSASLLVLQCFRRRSLAWLFAAIGWHWLVDALAVYMVGRHGIYWTEAVVGVCALVGVGIILALRDPEKAEGVPLADTSAGGPEP